MRSFVEIPKFVSRNLWMIPTKSDGEQQQDQSTLYNLHPNYLEPSKVDHPLEENVLLAFGKGCCFYLLGFLIGLPMIMLLVALMIVIVPLRILAYVVTRLSFRGLYRNILCRRHCDPWWPLEPQSVTGAGKSQSCSGSKAVFQQLPLQCVVTLQGSLGVNDLKELLRQKLIRLQDSSGYIKYPKFSQVLTADCCCGLNRSWEEQASFKVEHHVIGLCENANLPSTVDLETNVSRNAPSTEDGGKVSGVWSLKDLETELNRLAVTRLDSKRPLWSVDVVPNFGESRCTLLVFRFHSVLTDKLCIPKLFSLLNDGALSFDSEPKLRGSVLPPYNFFVSISYTLWTWCQMLTAGPLALVVSAWRRPEKVWEDATLWTKRKSGGSLQPSTSSRRRFRGTSEGSTESGASQRLTSLSVGGGSSQRNFALKRVTWARVPNVEQMMRAERILRSSTIELLLSFIAGALRRHFRSQGVRYPPDIQVTLPVSCREFMPIGRHQPCRFLTVPIMLPVSVEGSIPRVWEVQRLLAEALDGPYPQAMRAATSIGDLIMPSNWSKKILQKTHNGSSCVISYLRLSGEPNLHSKKIHSMLLYPPTPAGVRSAFTFVQTGHEIVVSLSVDQRTFPDPDVVLAGFQAELQSLLKQLALRMLTLSQATFLPAPLLARLSQSTEEYGMSSVGVLLQDSEEEKREAARKLSEIQAKISERNNKGLTGDKESGALAQQEVRPEIFQPGTSASQLLAIDASAEDANREESLEELERLMGSVQAELDAMRANPRGNRSDYIAKLSDLEEKMERFHRSITERLKQNVQLSKRTPSGSEMLELGVPMEALLQPYREEADNLEGSGSRAARKDSGFKLRRKKSKRLDSPTRISPKVGISWESENP